MPRTCRLALLALSVCALPALAGEKLLKNDTFTGSGTVNAPIQFPDYAGAGVVVTPAPGDYPASLIAVDVMCVPAQGTQVGDVGAYWLDVWGERSDGGVAPAVFRGDLFANQIQLTTSTTMFNRFTFTSPITITQGSIFIGVREQLSSSFDNTTIAMDDGPTATGRNYYFDGFGYWSVITGTGSGTPESVDRNWIIRGVIDKPDAPPVVTAITPNSGTNAGPVNVVITGDAFSTTSRAFLGTTELTVTSRAPPTQLSATVPAGLPQGGYDVIVENPALPTSLRGTLPQGYFVIDVIDAGTTDGGTNPQPDGGTGTDGGTGADDGGVPAGLRLDSVAPNDLWAGDTNDLTVLGAGFDPEVQLLIGGKVVPSFERKSPAVITSTLAPKTLGPGIFDVTVINADGSQATLEKALTVHQGVSVPAGCSCNSLDGALAAMALLGLLVGRRRS